MSQLTVGEAWTLEGVNRLQLVGGKTGLSREIQYVTVVEIPESIMWKGKEFLITTFSNVKDDVDTQINLMEEACKKNCAALAILSHPQGAYSAVIHPSLIASADRLGLPLFMIPNKVPYIDIITPIYQEIVNRQYSALKYALDLDTEMTGAILAGKNLHDLCKILSEFLTTLVLIVDRWGSPRALASPNDAATLDVFLEQCRADRLQISDYIGVANRIWSDKTHEKTAFVRHPIRAGGYKYGEIIIQCQKAELSRYEAVALDKASTILALYMEREQAIEEARLRIQRDVLDDLLSGTSREHLKSKFSSFGWPVEGIRSILLVKTNATSDFAKESAYLQKANSDDSFKIVRHILAGHSPSHIAIRRGDSIVIISHFSSSISIEEAKRLSVQLARSLIRDLEKWQWRVRIGIGNPYADIQKLYESYQEAEIALSIGQMICPEEKAIHADNVIGHYYLSKALTEEESDIIINTFVRELIEYDREHSSELLKTLETYYSYGCRVSQTASTLCIHRNTLKYRLDKIKEILGFDPMVDPYRLNVQMALALYRIKNKYS